MHGLLAAGASFMPVFVAPLDKLDVLVGGVLAVFGASRTIGVASADDVVRNTHVVGDDVVRMPAGTAGGDALVGGCAHVKKTLEEGDVVVGIRDHS